jgi:hypothetical protein
VLKTGWFDLRSEEYQSLELAFNQRAVIDWALEELHEEFDY